MNISKVFSVFLRNFHPSTEKSNSTCKKDKRRTESALQKEAHPQKVRHKRKARTRKEHAPKKSRKNNLS